jgi:hypothetical protein
MQRPSAGADLRRAQRAALITVPDRDQVTEDDVALGRLLAEAVGLYVAELERRVSPGQDPAVPQDSAGRAA